ncbi:hypothetical protein Bca52824_017410 [Brassica carinata]|uniref:Replication protein A 70 kDa DNA-binding subunit B/D first OB fold domain-containing protein n=1 Tax=Brassica carinata TaxID=52824 RepID=A0A8X8AXE8_BRACI|nr:hypothetical protein Bca52824_017410 [Brassica carinata]
MPTSSSSSGDHLFVRPSSSDSSSDTSADSPSDTSADSPSVALIPTPSDAVSERSSHTSVRCVANVISLGPDSCPAAPPVGYTAIFRAYRGIGFLQNLSWIMVELCGLFRIAPSQLTLRSWGLLHALQVLSDLSGVDITGSMVATGLCTREIGEGSRRSELSPRPFFRSHVVLPEWLDNTPTSGEYFFAVHLGPRPNGLRLSWSPSGEKIQATIPHECVLYFVDDLQDQNWYSIKDFKIKTNVGRTMTTNNTFKLKFPYISSSLNLYPSNFVDIIHRRLDFQIAVDVIGLLVSCAPIQFRFNEESKINDIAFLSFKIEDDRERIIECQAVGMHEYNQVLWNPDVPEVNALRERFFFALESDEHSSK